MVCLPAIAATAYFVAVILLDLYNRNWREIPGHALFGVFAVLLLIFICQKGSDVVAWILLGAPLLLVLGGYLLSVWFMAPESTKIPVDPPSSCPCCHYNRCRCWRPCLRPRPRPRPSPEPEPNPEPNPKPKPEPEPKPKPNNCIKPSLADE